MTVRRWASYWSFAAMAIVKPEPPSYFWVDHVSQYERNIGGRDGSAAGFRYELPADKMPLVLKKSRRVAAECEEPMMAEGVGAARVLAVVPFYVGSDFDIETERWHDDDLALLNGGRSPGDATRDRNREKSRERTAVDDLKQQAQEMRDQVALLPDGDAKRQVASAMETAIQALESRARAIEADAYRVANVTAGDYSVGANAHSKSPPAARVLQALGTVCSARRRGMDVLLGVCDARDAAALMAAASKYGADREDPVFRIRVAVFECLRGGELPFRSVHAAAALAKQRRPSHDAARDDAGANRSSWNYEFIYYTEADQVVHSGTLEPLLENLTLDPRIIVVPSRGEEMLDHRKCTEECRGHEEPDSPCMLACVNDDAGHRYSLRQNCLDMPRHAPAALREDEVASQPNVITAALAADRERGKFAVVVEAARENLPHDNSSAASAAAANEPLRASEPPAVTAPPPPPASPPPQPDPAAEKEAADTAIAHRIRRRQMALTKLRAELRDGSLPQDEFERKGRDVILATRLPGEDDPAGKSRDVTELAYSWTIRDARSRPKFREAMRAAGMLGNRTSGLAG